MKYLPSCLAVLVGCIAVGIAIYITKEPNCLWALLIVYWMAHDIYPGNN